MPSVETSIWVALRQRINTLPLTYSKAWPAEKFEVPNDGIKPLPFLRIGRVSVAPVRQLVDAGKRHLRSGSLIITLVYPLGQDIAVYDEIAGKIAAHFKDGTQSTYNGVCVSMVEYPNVQEGYEDNGYWNVPVVISWRSFS